MFEIVLFVCAQWKLLVVDEGHRIKNLESQLLKQLKLYPSENRLLLTGTPLQNSLKELWSLLNFLLPDLFNSLDKFQSWFQFSPSSLEQSEGRQYILDAERDHALVSKLHSILTPFVLRRLKQDVLTLPPKYEYILYTPLSTLQREYYLALLDKSIEQIIGGNNKIIITM